MSCEFVCLRFHGANVEQVLNGQCSQDIRDLNHSTSKLVAFCNSKGRMYGSGRLFREKDVWLLITPSNQAQNLIQRLLPFVQLARVTTYVDERPVFLTSKPVAVGYVENQSIIRVGEHGRTSWVIGGSMEIELFAHRQRIEAGLHFITEETEESLIPQQAHYQILGGVSFTKGCYTGQEVIARLEHLGKTKKWLWIYRHTIDQGTVDIELDNGEIAKCIETVTTEETQTSLVLAAHNSTSKELIRVPFKITRQVSGQRPVKLR